MVAYKRLVKALEEERKSVAEFKKAAEAEIKKRRLSKSSKNVSSLFGRRGARRKFLATKSAHEKLGDQFIIEELNLKMIWVQPGNFNMGTYNNNSSPRHKVTLTEVLPSVSMKLLSLSGKP